MSANRVSKSSRKSEISAGLLYEPSPSMSLIDACATVLFFILSGVLHFKCFKVGVGLLHADLGIFHLLGRDISEGNLRIFPYAQSYGGLPLTYLRAVAIWFGSFFRTSPTTSSLTFSYFILPGLQAALAYWALLRAHSRLAGVFGAAIVACGFQFWYEHFSNDYYPPVFILTLILIGIRGSGVRVPTASFSRWKLFLLGLLSGLAIYTNRMCLIPLTAFWLPWESIQWKELFSFIARALGLRPLGTAASPQGRLPLGARILRGMIAFLLGLWVYTAFFGYSLGTAFGRPVKIAPEPNLRLALLGFVILIAGWFKKDFVLAVNRVRTWVPPTAMLSLLAGITVGIIPEVIYRMGAATLANGVNPTDFGEWAQLIASIPSALKALFSWNNSAAQVTTLTLVGVGFVFMCVSCVRTKSLFWRHLAWGVGLSLYIYTNFRLHEDVVLRYLYPIQAYLVVGAAAACAELSRRMNTRWLAAILMTSSLTYQIQGRLKTSEYERAQAELSGMRTLAEAFKQREFKYVLSDTYKRVHLLTLLTERKPVFFPTENTLYDPSRIAELKQQKTVGYLSTGGPISSHEISAYGEKWCIDGAGAQVATAWVYSLSRCRKY